MPLQSPLEAGNAFNKQINEIKFYTAIQMSTNI